MSVVWEPQICDVCQLLDQDNSVKACSYCALCKAWLCAADVNDYSRRSRAMWTRHFRNLRLAPEVVEKAVAANTRSSKCCGQAKAEAK